MDINKDEEMICARLEELAEKSEKRGIYTFSDFLTPAQIQNALAAERIRKTPHLLWGGTDFTERKLIRFGDNTAIGYEIPFPISALYIKPAAAKFAQALNHRDFLGALMNLGIKRGVIGDIFTEENAAYAFVREQIALFITENLCKVKNTAVSCSVLTPDECEKLNRLRPRTEQLSITAASERLDAVTAAVCSVSRGASAELIRAGSVQVNHIVRYEVGITLKAGDVISVRGKGRFIFKGCSGISRKGRERIIIERYIT